MFQSGFEDAEWALLSGRGVRNLLRHPELQQHRQGPRCQGSFHFMMATEQHWSESHSDPFSSLQPCRGLSTPRGAECLFTVEAGHWCSVSTLLDASRSSGLTTLFIFPPLRLTSHFFCTQMTMQPPHLPHRVAK